MAENIAIRAERDGTKAVLRLDGYINNVGGEELVKVCNGLLDDGVRRLVFDLSGCGLVNSVGISFLIELFERMEELQGRIAFCHLTPTIDKTFRIMGLLQMSTVHPTRDEAIAAVDADD